MKLQHFRFNTYHILHGMREFDYSMGRPYDELSIIYYSSCVKLVQDYGISINNRVMGTIFSVNNQFFLLCKVYLPCFCDTVDYINDVNTICGFMESVVFSNAGKQFYMIICGNFNVEVNKLNMCASLGCLRLFLERHSLQCQYGIL